MYILAIDGSNSLGFARGDTAASAPEVSGSIRLKKPSYSDELAWGRGARWFIETVRDRRPDLVIIEHPQSSGSLMPREREDGSFERAKGSAAAIDSQRGYYAMFHGLCAAYGLRADCPWPHSVRKLVCGRPYAEKVFDPKTKRMVAGDTKQMVIDHLAMLSLIDPTSKDHNKADAIALWLWGKAIHGRVAVPLVLT